MELSAWINPAYLDEEWLATAQQAYMQAQPYPHLQITDWLLEDRLEELEEALSQLPFNHKESDLFSLAQTDNLETIDDPTIREYISFLNSDELRSWFQEITRIHTTPGKLDLFGAIYGDADYLLPHDDQLDDRKIAFILYLSTLTEDQGGALVLYTAENGHPGKIVQSYQPLRNALNFFTVSETSWHEVEEVTDDMYRVSCGGWLRG